MVSRCATDVVMCFAPLTVLLLLATVEAYPHRTLLLTNELFPSRDQATALARRSVGPLDEEMAIEKAVMKPRLPMRSRDTFTPPEDEPAVVAGNILLRERPSPKAPSRPLLFKIDRSYHPVRASALDRTFSDAVKHILLRIH